MRDYIQLIKIGPIAICWVRKRIPFKVIKVRFPEPPPTPETDLQDRLDMVNYERRQQGWWDVNRKKQ
jgi:hypothetical protein